MSQEKVTFRLSLSDPAGADMAEIRSSLKAIGFDVERDGRRGFLLSAPPALIESTFKTRISYEKGQAVFQEEPNEDDILKDKPFRAYFPTRPEYFK